jgi:hypothetical protein
MTLIDQRHLLDRASPNCTVQTAVDADRGFDVVVEAISHFSR